ncbi:MAG: hypothetical protein M4579_006554 [Chaenotheca gracillima]|nr:MAG: hypothetical protein M4579_006554 [Chaenotheca gracillima]
MGAHIPTDALSRLRASPLSGFLVSTLSPYRPHIAGYSARAAPFCSSPASRSQYPRTARGFSTSSYLNQQSSAAEKEPEDDGSSNSQSSPQQSSQPRPTQRSNNPFYDEVATMIDSIPKSKTEGATGQRTSRFSSQNAQARNRPTTSANDVMKSFHAHVDRIKSSSDRSSTSSLGDRMQMPASQSRDVDGLRSLGGQRSAPPQPAETPPLRLTPSIGRTVPVILARGYDLSRSLNQLNVKCIQNSVRKDATMQRFHERPGLKRKRLKRQRWRKLFKDGFRGMVYKVQKMKRQGW